MKTANRLVIVGLSLLPWLAIWIGGTVSFQRLATIQDELGVAQQQLRDQQTELAKHQRAIDEQVKTTLALRSQTALTLGDALLRQCVENYRIDTKLSRLGIDLYAAPSLDHNAKQALADFSAEVAQNQGDLHCRNPISRPKTHKGRGVSHVSGGSRRDRKFAKHHLSDLSAAQRHNGRRTNAADRILAVHGSSRGRVRSNGD
jgi:hypothetical protein